MKINFLFALYTGKAAGHAARLLRLGGGSTLPGRIARRLCGSFIQESVRNLPRGCILVTGTNGKTTTSTLLASILDHAGIKTIHNRTGANLMAGIASALIRESDLKGHIDAEIGLFEVDEAALPAAVAETSPRIVIVNNLFRDQLDRYGELDTLAVKIREAISNMASGSKVILNADDPLVASLSTGIDREVLYFGIETDRYTTSSPQHAADSKSCPVCGSPLKYDYYLFGHMGKYRCRSCGRPRPVPGVSAASIEMEGMKGTRGTVRTETETFELFIPLPGLYNVYNALAATSAAVTAGVDIESITATVKGFTAAFGRVEHFDLKGRHMIMILAKNPAGYNEVIRTLRGEPGRKNAFLALNDNIADGRDVSWIWDIDFEMLDGALDKVTCSGIRASDIALRVKYAEIGQSSLEIENNLDEALDIALNSTSEGGTLYVVPTYTAMLDLRKLLVRRGAATHFWEN